MAPRADTIYGRPCSFEIAFIFLDHLTDVGIRHFANASDMESVKRPKMYFFR